jgi:hypothetical protein
VAPTAALIAAENRDGFSLERLEFVNIVLHAGDIVLEARYVLSHVSQVVISKVAQIPMNGLSPLEHMVVGHLAFAGVFGSLLHAHSSDSDSLGVP